MTSKQPSIPEILQQIGGVPAIEAALESITELKVLVIGDAIIDEYRYVVPLSRPPKENCLCVHSKDREDFAGGVFATAATVANFCGQVTVCTWMGPDRNAERLVDRALPQNCVLKAKVGDWGTTYKKRYIDAFNRKLFEVYAWGEGSMTRKARDELDDHILAVLTSEKWDLVVINDFGHGFLADTTLARWELADLKYVAINTQTNSGNFGFNLISQYTDGQFVCIDEPEARLAASDQFGPIEKIAFKVLSPHENILITRGRLGCYAVGEVEGPFEYPAFVHSVVDTVGAGDAAFSVASPLAAVGTPLGLVAFIANAAGAVETQVVGHRRYLTPEVLMDFVRMMETTGDGIA